jgi:hypothetical protein
MQLFLQISISPNLTPVRPQLSELSLSHPCIHNTTHALVPRTRPLLHIRKIYCCTISGVAGSLFWMMR